MYIQRIIILITASIFLGTFFASTVQAETPLSPPIQTPFIYDIAEVREVSCYRYFLEADDVLCIVRYALVDSSGTLSVSGSFLQMANSTSTLATVFAPIEDYGLAAFYFEADDANKPIWDDATTQVIFKANPFVAPTQPDSTPFFVTFVTTVTAGGSFGETIDEIVADLGRMMLRLEEDSPLFNTEDLVIGVGITPLGKFIVEQAHAPLITVASNAFILASEFAASDHNPGTVPIQLTDIEQAGRTSKFSLGMASIGAIVGLGFQASMFVILIILIVGVFWGIKHFNGNIKAGFYYVWPMIVVMGYLGGFPFEAIALIPIGIFLAGAGLFIRRYIPIGG